MQEFYWVAFIWFGLQNTRSYEFISNYSIRWECERLWKGITKEDSLKGIAILKEPNRWCSHVVGSGTLSLFNFIFNTDYLIVISDSFRQYQFFNKTNRLGFLVLNLLCLWKDQYVTYKRRRLQRQRKLMPSCGCTIP